MTYKSVFFAIGGIFLLCVYISVIYGYCRNIYLNVKEKDYKSMTINSILLLLFFYLIYLLDPRVKVHYIVEFFKNIFNL